MSFGSEKLRCGRFGFMTDYTDAKNAEKRRKVLILRHISRIGESGINEAVTVTSIGPENEGQNDSYSEVEFMPEYTGTENAKKR